MIAELHFIYRKMENDDGQPTLRLFLNEKLERGYMAFDGAVDVWKGWRSSAVVGVSSKAL